MTITYDPKHPAYYDEGDLRSELTRVYDLCHGCRLCLSLCPVVPHDVQCDRCPGR